MTNPVPRQNNGNGLIDGWVYGWKDAIMQNTARSVDDLDIGIAAEAGERWHAGSGGDTNAIFCFLCVFVLIWDFMCLFVFICFLCVFLASHFLRCVLYPPRHISFCICVLSPSVVLPPPPHRSAARRIRRAARRRGDAAVKRQAWNRGPGVGGAVRFRRPSGGLAGGRGAPWATPGPSIWITPPPPPCVGRCHGWAGRFPRAGAWQTFPRGGN